MQLLPTEDHLSNVFFWSAGHRRSGLETKLVKWAKMCQKINKLAKLNESKVTPKS